MAQLVSELGIPSLKVTRPVVTYKGTLTVGDPERYGEDAVRIEVQRWPCVALAKPQPMKTFAVKTDGGVESSAQSSATLQHDPMREELQPVKRDKTYQVNDPDGPGGKIDVEKNQLERCYEYGRTAVNISNDDMDVVKLDTEPCLDVVGFVDRAKVLRLLLLSVILANDDSLDDTGR
jgi:ATP-dependent DNA helicase 2 subunit 2